MTDLYLVQIYQDLDDDIKALKKQSIDTTLLSKASILDSLSNKLLSTIKMAKKEVVDRCGGRNEHFEINDPFNRECTSAVFINLGWGYEIKKALDQYEDFLLYEGVRFTEISRDASEIETFKNDPNIMYLDFEEYNFGNCSLIQSLLRLSTFEIHIMTLKKEYLTTLICS